MARIVIQKDSKGRLTASIMEIALSTTDARIKGKRIGTERKTVKGRDGVTDVETGGNLSLFGLGRTSIPVEGLNLIGVNGDAVTEAYLAACSASIHIGEPLPVDECRQPKAGSGKTRPTLTSVLLPKGK